MSRGTSEQHQCSYVILLSGSGPEQHYASHTHTHRNTHICRDPLRNTHTQAHENTPVLPHTHAHTRVHPESRQKCVEHGPKLKSNRTVISAQCQCLEHVSAYLRVTSCSCFSQHRAGSDVMPRTLPGPMFSRNFIENATFSNQHDHESFNQPPLDLYTHTRETHG